MSNAIMLAGVGEFMVYTFREEKTDFLKLSKGKT